MAEKLAVVDEGCLFLYGGGGNYLVHRCSLVLSVELESNAGHLKGKEGQRRKMQLFPPKG